MPKSPGKYVDGFVITMPKKNVDAYRKMAAKGGKLWRKYGALDYKECVIEDVKPKGVVLPFGKLVKAKPSETIVFSYIVFKNRTHRDAVNAKVMKDPSMNMEMDEMPFDMKRMSYGGFEVLVSE